MSINPSLLTASVVTAAVIAYILVQLFRENRLLFWSLLASVVLLFGSTVAVVGMTGLLTRLGILKPEGERLKEVRVAVAVHREKEKEKPKPDEPKPEPPKPNPIEELPLPKPKPIPKEMALPQGRLDGNPDAKVMPKGTNIDGKKAGAPGDPKKAPGAPGPKEPGAPAPAGPRMARASGRTITSGESDEGTMPGGEASLEGGLGSSGGIGKEDILGGGVGGRGRGGGGGGGGGEGGDNAGTPDGEGKGDIPLGFKHGRRGGKLYFVRLKHGSGAWNAHSEGLNRFLSFMNDKIMGTESSTWPLDTSEINDKFMKKGHQPTFLYFYCDNSFSLSGSDVKVLREYVRKGGFLFLDSLPDAPIKEKVQRELNKVFPSSRLAPISSSHPINKYMFQLSAPGVGLNVIERKNYGISQGGRLVAFYTPGNFAGMFKQSAPNADEYTTAQYQMAANVVFYANTKGNPEGITKRKGANAQITARALEKLGLFEGGSQPAKPVKPGAPPPTVKKQRTPQPNATPGANAEPEPDDIELLN